MSIKKELDKYLDGLKTLPRTFDKGEVTKGKVVKVKEGDLVKQGQYIGDLGNTGLSTGPHLHYEIRIGSQVIDPRKFIFVQKNMK